MLHAGTDFTEDEQRALYDWYVEQRGHTDLAARLGRTPHASRQLLCRAKAKLIRRMPQYAARECLSLLLPSVSRWLRCDAGAAGRISIAIASCVIMWFSRVSVRH